MAYLCGWEEDWFSRKRGGGGGRLCCEKWATRETSVAATFYRTSSTNELCHFLNDSVVDGSGGAV